MTPIGQYPSDYRAPLCNYCGSAVEANLAYPACRTCDTRNLFSDCYKDDTGVRPMLSAWTLRQMSDYLAARINVNDHDLLRGGHESCETGLCRYGEEDPTVMHEGAYL